MSNLPPREPPNLGDRGPRQSGQQPPQYPPPDQYPPPNQYPPPGGAPPPGPYTPPGTGQLPPRQPPSLGGQRPPGAPNLGASAPPPQLGKRKSGFRDTLHERRIEYLAWGSVVLILGFSIILLALDTETAQNVLLIITPLLSGGILLASGFVQRIVFNYPVSIVTWGTAIVSTAFGLTQFVALITERTGREYFTTQAIFFTGFLVIISGMVIILQVFRRARE